MAVCEDRAEVRRRSAEVVVEQHREALLDVARRLLDVRHEERPDDRVGHFGRHDEPVEKREDAGEAAEPRRHARVPAVVRGGRARRADAADDQRRDQR